MTTVKIAHLNRQGQDMIIVPLASDFGHKPDHEQESVIGELQMHTASARLRGHVVPVWDSGGGRMGFRAPENWHPFFESIDLQFVYRNVNKEISW